MRASPGVVAICLALLSGCGMPAPGPVRDGARISASLAAQWPTHGSPARQAVFSRDGTLLATSDASGSITIRGVDGWRPVAGLSHPGGATSLAFSNDNAHLFSGGYDGAIRIWDLRRRASTGALKGAQGSLWSLDMSPDGARLAAAGEDGIIRIWRLGSKAAPMMLRGHQRNIWDVRFSPDGKRLASGSFDETVRLWDAESGGAIKTLHGHSEAVVGLAFSPDGKLLATGGDDSTIRLWRTADGAQLRAIDNGNHAYELGFSPDGDWLASAGRARGGIGTILHRAGASSPSSATADTGPSWRRTSGR